MTKQEAFDVVARGLRSQGFRRSVGKSLASGKNESCVYDGPNGMHCAAGWLFKHFGMAVPDEMNGFAFSDVLAARPAWELRLGSAIFPGKDDWLQRHSLRSFVRVLQNAHDGGERPYTMWCELKLAATLAGLSWTELGEPPSEEAQ